MQAGSVKACHMTTEQYVACSMPCRALVIPVCWPDAHPDPRLPRKCSTVAWLGALPSSAGQELRAAYGIDGHTNASAKIPLHSSLWRYLAVSKASPEGVVQCAN